MRAPKKKPIDVLTSLTSFITYSQISGTQILPPIKPFDGSYPYFNYIYSFFIFNRKLILILIGFMRLKKAQDRYQHRLMTIN
jgi:hypothetical protein